jgi:hypothetical protein
VQLEIKVLAQSHELMLHIFASSALIVLVEIKGIGGGRRAIVKVFGALTVIHRVQGEIVILETIGFFLVELQLLFELFPS